MLLWFFFFWPIGYVGVYSLISTFWEFSNLLSLLIANFIPLWPENVLCMIPILWNFLRFFYGLACALSSKMHHVHLRRYVCMIWDKFLYSELVKCIDLKYTGQWTLINVHTWVNHPLNQDIIINFRSSIVLSSGTNAPLISNHYSDFYYYILVLLVYVH